MRKSYQLAYGTLEGTDRERFDTSALYNMQFSDYIVSYALQNLSRCLQKAGDYEQELLSSDEKALVESAERLLSLWQMMQLSIGKLQYKRAQADLQEIALLCTGPGTPEIRGAERLLEKADDRSQRLIRDLLGELPESRIGQDRDRLSCLLQEESGRWREYAVLRQIDDEDLIRHGMLRAFDRSLELNARLDRIQGESQDIESRRMSPKRLKRAARWVGHCVNHLELLRPALSEQGRTRRWHLNRLRTRLDDQWELEAFARAVKLMELRPKSTARLGKLIGGQRRRLDKQRRKLTIGAFAGGEKAFLSELTLAVGKLGLKEIVLLDPGQKVV